MKNLLLSIVTLLVTQYSAQQQSQIIFNEVPIHFSYSTELNEYWDNPHVIRDQFDRQLNNEAMPIEAHHDFFQFILKGVKSGKLKVYKPDISERYLTPSEFFQTLLPSDSIDLKNFPYYFDNMNPDYINVLYEYYISVRMDENDDLMYDEYTGDQLLEYSFTELEERDFVSITFIEKWDFDTPSKKFSKTVLGFTCNTHEINEDTGDKIGIQPRFYIKMNPFSKSATNWKVATNFVSTSTINGADNDEKGFQEHRWWLNNIETSKRYNLIQPLFSGSHDYLEAKAPFNQSVVNKEKVLNQYEEYHQFDDDFYEEMYDENGDPIMIIDSSLYTYLDINKLGFVEDWYFDTINFSFGKEVKGIMPCKINYGETGKLLASTPLFLINTNGNVIENKPSDFELPNHRMSMMLVNNKVTDLKEKWFERLNQNNGINIDSIAQIKMNSFFINYPNTEGANTLTSLFGDDYQIQKNTQLLMNEVQVVPRMDYETGEYMYDEITGDELYDSILIPYAYQDIIGFEFIESWNYNITENQFDIDISGVIPMIWYTSPETGEIKGRKEMYMAKPNPNHKAEYALIKSSHVFTEPWTIKTSENFWNYRENTEWLYPQKRKELIQSLFEGIKSKKVEVINPVNNEKIKLKNREIHIDGKTFTDIKSIQFEEDVYFNYASGHFKKVVKSVTLFIGGYSEYEEPIEYAWMKVIFTN